MRAPRSLSTRIASVGAAMAVAAAGLVGAVGLVATATPAGAASTPLGTTTCALSTGDPRRSPRRSIATISPNPVNAGNNYTLAGLALHSNLIANATTSAAAGLSLTVTFASTLTATGATPTSEPVSFSGSVTLPKPFPVGAAAPISLDRDGRRVHGRRRRGDLDVGLHRAVRLADGHARHHQHHRGVQRAPAGGHRHGPGQAGRRRHHHRGPELRATGPVAPRSSWSARTSPACRRSTSGPWRPPTCGCSAPTSSSARRPRGPGSARVTSPSPRWMSP